MKLRNYLVVLAVLLFCPVLEAKDEGFYLDGVWMYSVGATFTF